MAANARAFGFCFNPISVFWCFDASGEQAGVVVEVHNTYGDRHAYLVHPDEQGRARTDKAMYVSPFHGTDGTYELAVPVPAGLPVACVSRLLCTPTTVPRSARPSRARRQPRRPWAWSGPLPQHCGGGADPGTRHLALGAAAPGDQPTRPLAPEGSPVTLAPSRPSSLTWPGLHVVPTGPRARLSSRIARRLFTSAVSRLPVSVRLADGDRLLGRGGPEMVVHDPDEFFARIGSAGLIGFGEAYLTRAWEADDLGGVLTVLAAELPRLVPTSLQRLRAAYVARPPRHQKSSVRNAQANIGHHYDLSNDLFETFLDETMTYSSALFDDSHPGLSAGLDREVLREAQVRKIERLLDATGVGPGTRLLEIGTGWGELAIRAARRGAIVDSVTLSVEQQSLARQRIARPRPTAPSTPDRCRSSCCDYRRITVSVATTPSARSR